MSPAPDIPARLLGDGLLRSAAAVPDKPALVIEGRTHTYAELHAAASAVADHLVRSGVERGDRVAVYMDNTWFCAASLYGALLAGAAFVVINPQTKRGKLQTILDDCGAAALLTDEHLAVQWRPVIGAVDSLRVVASSGTGAGEGVASLDGICGSGAGRPAVATIPGDLAALIYTSGSTGRPKGVMQTHQSMVFASWSLIEYLRLTRDDRILSVLPLAFDYGLYQLLMSVSLGATLVLERSFTFPGKVYRLLAESRATVFPGIPTIFATMIASHRKAPLSFPDVGAITNTAAALPAEFVPVLHEIFPSARIYKMYGLTECKRVSYLEPELIDEHPDTVGRAIPGTEVFLLGADGEPVGPGEPGILHVRGPHVMAGYWNRPEQTAHMLREGPLPGERHLCTHDWFTMDELGLLRFVGRSDDIIKTRGEKVSPKEVEDVLHAVPGVGKAAVVGVPDASLGQAVRAFVEPDGTVDLTEAAVRKECADRLENFMVPQRVIVMERLPETANGKVDRKRLAERSDDDD